MFYGRASKIIAIYLKTSVILPNHGETEICFVIHQPIDRILLNSLSKNKEFKDLAFKTWTTFNKEDYWDLVQRVRKSDLHLDWRLEESWKLI